MQYYKPDDNRRGKVIAVITTAGFYLAVGLLLLIRIPLPEKQWHPLDDGVMVNFGDVESASGTEDTAMSDDFSQARAVTQPTPAASPRPVTNSSTVRGTTGGDVATGEQTPAEQPRTADARALFPGRTAGSTSTSEGTGTGSGNQGNPAGSATGSHSGTGTGTSGASYNLSGRSPVGALPKPDYNSDREGRVVVEITVSPEGAVTNAVYRASGSIGVDNAMIQDALMAARKARFTSITADSPQSGTITYIFKMN